MSPAPPSNDGTPTSAGLKLATNRRWSTQGTHLRVKGLRRLKSAPNELCRLASAMNASRSRLRAAMASEYKACKVSRAGLGCPQVLAAEWPLNVPSNLDAAEQFEGS